MLFINNAVKTSQSDGKTDRWTRCRPLLLAVPFSCTAVVGAFTYLPFFFFRDVLNTNNHQQRILRVISHISDKTRENRFSVDMLCGLPLTSNLASIKARRKQGN